MTGSRVTCAISAMRLCFIGDMNSIHVRKWVRFFCERGHEVLVISTSYYRASRFFSASVVSLPPPRTRDILDRLGLLQLAKRLQSVSRQLLPDEVVLEQAERRIAETQQALIQRRLHLINTYKDKVRQMVHQFRPDLIQCLRLFPEGFLGSFCEFQPLVQMAWGCDANFYPDRYPEIAKLVRRAVSNCAAYFADSERDIQDARRYGLPANVPWHVTPGGGGVETDELGEVVHRSATREDKQTPVFMTYRGIGRPGTDNRPVICGLAILRERYKLDARFVIYGHQGGPYYDQVRIIAKRLGMSPYVKVLPPFPYSELKNVLGKYELIVSAATVDGTSNALLETMWLGGIPLVSDLPQNREWVTDGVNGYIFDLTKPEHIAEKFAQALAEADKYDQMRAINREIIRKRADYKTCMGKVEQIYRQLIEKTKR